MNNCVFCKIVKKEIEAKVVFEDNDFIAFHDIKPSAPIHILLIPKKHVESLQNVDKNDAIWLGKMLSIVPQIAFDNGCKKDINNGFRLLVNSGIGAGQEVPHLHFHILGGFSIINKNNR